MTQNMITLALSQVLVDSTRQLSIAVGALRTGDSMKDAIIEVHRLENEGDAIMRQSLAKLFREEKDPLVVIKWKEIYENLEQATDRCEDVANIIEGVVLENS